MSETNFTPGPWTPYWYEKNKRTHSGEWIFTAPSQKFAGSSTNVWLKARTGEPEANARLMAAAPDLLEACRFIKAHLDSLESALPENDPLRVARRYYHAPLHAKLDAAIAKAQGKP